MLFSLPMIFLSDGIPVRKELTGYTVHVCSEALAKERRIFVIKTSFGVPNGKLFVAGYLIEDGIYAAPYMIEMTNEAVWRRINQ